MPALSLLSPCAIQPSQLFVNDDKLRACLADPDPAPIPIAKLDGALICTDGHTRALAALIRREPEIKVVEETGPLEWDLYRACVAWCHERDIRSIADLRHRVVPSDEYRTLWLDRCARLRQSGANC